MAKAEKSWEKRLSGSPDELAMNFVESLSFDTRLYKYDITGSIAHAKMLAKQGLITADEYAQIEAGLNEIVAEIEAGQFDFDPVLEDIHMAVEAALVEKTGDAGRKLHTGRSRNDQVATDMRLWMRDEIDHIISLLRNLQKALVRLAAKNTDAIMPSYTHLQRAQPIVIAAYLLSFVEQFDRDCARLENSRAIMNISPLGSGAAAGSTLPLDRRYTAQLLGFDGITHNSLDGVADRDFCAQFIFDCSMIAIHLSRLAEDWIIYTSNEFGFIRTSDKYCTSSSMMPQKRNPDMLELIRGKSGAVLGNLVSMLTVLKSLPSTYNRDLQDDKRFIFGAADTVCPSIEITTGIVSNTEFLADRIGAGIEAGFLDATCLAEYLVSKGVPFRQAHGIVGAAVAMCEKQQKTLAQVEPDEYKQMCGAIEQDVYDYLGTANVVSRYVTEGAGGSRQSAERIAYWNERLGTDE